LRVTKRYLPVTARYQALRALSIIAQSSIHEPFQPFAKKDKKGFDE